MRFYIFFNISGQLYYGEFYLKTRKVSYTINNKQIKQYFEV